MCHTIPKSHWLGGPGRLVGDEYSTITKVVIQNIQVAASMANIMFARQIAKAENGGNRQSRAG